VLPRFFGLSRSEAEQLRASLRPVEVIPVRDVVTPLAAGQAPRTVASANPQPVVAGGRPASDDGGALFVSHGETASPDRVAAAVVRFLPEPPRDEIEPLNAELSRLHVTVTRRLLEKLEAAKDALAHACPGGSAARPRALGLRRTRGLHANAGNTLVCDGP
jgi:hypothetical protein